MVDSIETTRDRILQKADELFYQQGFEYTSFSNIADAVQISRGNFYYHFKAKDEILDAVIRLRVKKTQDILDNWSRQFSDPKARIQAFINIMMMNKTLISQYGCPVGTLCSELAKINHDALEAAQELFLLFRHWLANEFSQLGFIKNGDDLAVHLLAMSQGVATMAATFRDEKLIRQQVKMLHNWLNNLGES